MNPSIPDLKKFDVASSPFLAGDSRASSSATPFGDALDISSTEWPCGQSPCQDWDDHAFEETYYGHKCSKCGLFYAHGCAPWEDITSAGHSPNSQQRCAERKSGEGVKGPSPLSQEHPKEAGILGRFVLAAPERVHEGTATISSFAAVRVEGPPAVRSEQTLSADVCPDEFYLYAEANQFYRHGENAMNRSRRLWQIRCALARIRWYWIMPVMFFAFLVWLWATVLMEATK